MSNKMKPCPFCGVQGNKDYKPSLRVTQCAVHDYTIGASVFCPSCGIEMHDEYLPDVVEQWNTRAADARLAAIEAENARLRGALDTIINHPPTDHDFTSDECLSMCVDFAREALSGEVAQ